MALDTAEIREDTSMFAEASSRELVVLSDFDHTLCDTYTFDATTNNHQPLISEELVAAAGCHHLIVATGRRANHPSLPSLWDAGLVHPDLPVIAENGGTLAFHYDEGPGFLDLVDTADLSLLNKVQEDIANEVISVPEGQRLAFKVGRTMLLARIQDKDGVCEPHHQAWLQEQVQPLLPSRLRAVDTRGSVTIQHRDVDKRSGFQTYLELCGIKRSDIFVVGMGDGPNDKEIFEEADLRIGFSSAVRDLVDIDVPAGPQAAPKILAALQVSAPLRQSV